MSVYPTEIITGYGSANMPEADGVTVGGAVDLTRMIVFSDMAATGTVDFVSSSASDTATQIQVAGRDTSGIIQTPAAVTLTGLTKVAGTQAFQRLLYAAASGATANGPLAAPAGTAAVGDVAIMAHTLTLAARTCQAGSANHAANTPPLMKLEAGDGASVTLGMIIRLTGGTGVGQLRMASSASGTGRGQYGTDTIAVNRDWTTIPDTTTTYEIATGMLFPILPNPVRAVIRPFVGAESDVVGGLIRYYYEKAFVLNTDAATALTNQTLSKTLDPAFLYADGGALDIVPCTALNDIVAVANRQTAPASGVGAYSSGAAPQSVILAAQTAAGNSASQAQGFWLRLTLVPDMTPYNGFFQMRSIGATT